MGASVEAISGVPRPPQADVAMIAVRLSTVKIFFRINMVFLLTTLHKDHEIDALHVWGVPIHIVVLLPILSK